MHNLHIHPEWLSGNIPYHFNMKGVKSQPVFRPIFGKKAQKLGHFVTIKRTSMHLLHNFLRESQKGVDKGMEF